MSQLYLAQLREELRLRVVELHAQLAAHAVSTDHDAQRHESAFRCHVRRYSRISSTARLLCLAELAASNVRNARAVRPSLPITLPRSPSPTLNSMMTVFSPSTASTSTASGSSTRAFAMNS